MGKINNTTAYEATAPTADTILIGSAQAGNNGTTHNYLVSALATYMSSNITTLTDLTLSGFLTVGGATTLSSSLTVEGLTTFNDGVTATSTFRLTGLSTFADNAAALGGGLVANDVYKTATGELRIVV